MMDKWLTEAVAEITNKRESGHRVVVAISGPPATGKSTFSKSLCDQLNIQPGISSVVVPMDGFHLDNEQLNEMQMLQRKGAPETFDFDGFASLLSRLSDCKSRVYYPVFDRGLDKAIAGAKVVKPENNVILVEGNYLLLDENPWRNLAKIFDHTIYIGTPINTLKDRLIQRWIEHDHSPEEALERALSNDIPNAERVCAHIMKPDQTFLF